MSRVIKFRAWDNHQQVWLRRNDAAYLSASVRGIYKAKTRPHVILMQYTGLLDVTGEEIYEGDIISGSIDIIEFAVTGAVIFSEGCFQILSPISSEPVPLYGLTGVHVIGNLHENPGLLKGQS